MKITKRQFRRIIKEAQWGNFTGGAAPLDLYDTSEDPIPKDQLKKISDIFINDMGMSPEEVLKTPEFIKAGITNLAQLDESKTKITKRQLRKIIGYVIQESLVTEEDLEEQDAISGAIGPLGAGNKSSRKHNKRKTTAINTKSFGGATLRKEETSKSAPFGSGMTQANLDKDQKEIIGHT